VLLCTKKNLDCGAKERRVQRVIKLAMLLEGNAILKCKVRFDRARILLPQPAKPESVALIIRAVMVEQTETYLTLALRLLVHKADCAIF